MPNIEFELDKAIKYAHLTALVSKAKQERMSRGKDNVEFVSPSEVYLLDASNNRVRRICGKPKRYPMNDGYYCLSGAGMGTVHPGTGHCRRHEKMLGIVAFDSRLGTILSSGYGKELRDRLIACDISKSDLMKNVDPEIELLYGILSNQLNQDRENISLKYVKELIEQLVATKKVKFDLESKSLFTKEELFNYIRLVIETCRLVLDKVLYAKLLQVLETTIGQRIDVEVK